MGGLSSELMSELKLTTYSKPANQHGRQLKGFHPPKGPGNCLKWCQRSFFMKLAFAPLAFALASLLSLQAPQALA